MRGGVMLLVGLTACSGRVEELILPVARGGSALVVQVEEGAPPLVRALALPEPPEAYVALPVPPGPAALAAAFSDCDLGELGLSGGPVALSAEGKPPPAPARFLALDFQPGQLSTWTEGPPSASFVELRLAPPPRDRCVPLQAIAHDLGLDNEVRMLAVYGEDVLAGTETGKLFLARRDALRELTVAGHHTLTGYRDDGGTVWMMGRNAEPMRMTPPEESPVLAGTRAPAEYVRPAFRLWMDGAPDGSELWVLDDNAGIARFEPGRGWTGVRPRCARCTGRLLVGRPPLARVLWLGPDDVLFVGTSTVLPLRHRPGMGLVRERIDPLGLDANFTTAARLPGLGVLVASELGLLYRQEGESWRRLAPPPPLPEAVRSLARLGRGFLVAGPGGGLTYQWHPVFGYCPVTSAHPGALALAVEHGPGLAFGGGRASVASSEHNGLVLFLDPLGPPLPACARLVGEEGGP